MLRSLAFFILFLAAMTGCSRWRPTDQATSVSLAPPLPQALHRSLHEWYPDASKRLHEQGRVVVDGDISPAGVLIEPVSIDRTQTDATPRLEEAASKLLRGIKFDIGDRYKKRVTISIVFELVPCGSIAPPLSVDYRVNICLDPSPYADVDEHPPSEIESQIDKVLRHGDLADIDFLEDTLGVKFRVTPPVRSPNSYSLDGKPDLTPHVLVTPTQVPKLFRVDGLEYESQANTDTHTSNFRLNIPPVECPNIAFWAARLKLPSTSSSDPHGFGHGTDFQSGGEHGISVSAFYHTGGGCQLSLSQRKEMSEPFSTHIDRDLISPAPLVEGLAMIIASGDIREVARAEHALGTIFTTPGPGAFGVNYEIKTIIPGVEPGYFEYSVNDTGKENASIFFYVPPKPANRTARLRLIVDVYHVCIRPGQFSGELSRRGIHFQHSAKYGEDSYLIRGNNEIRVRLERFGGCIRDVTLLQTTDFKHPIVRKTNVHP